MGEIGGRGIEDACRITRGGLALNIDRGKAAQDDAEGKAQMICGGLGVEFFDIFGKRISLRAVNSLLSPVLGVSPSRG
jgi:hypothetical protein